MLYSNDAEIWSCIVWCKKGAPPMSFKFSQRLLRSLLFISLLIGLAGCGGKSGGTAVVVPDFDRA